MIDIKKIKTAIFKNLLEEDIIWKFLCYLKENRRGIKLYAHCAAQYDNKFILSSLCDHDQVIILEAGLAKLKWVDADISFEDSYLLLPSSLSKIAQAMKLPSKGIWDHNLGLKPWEMDDTLSTFKEYLRRDCLILSEALDKLCEDLITHFAVTPSISLAATAVKALDKGFYKVRKIDSNEQYEPYIRAATYGGRNEVYHRTGHNILHYDVKSMFVSCYDSPVPIGKMQWIKPDIDRGTIVEASVKVPKDLYIGPLPYRRPSGLIFPTGEFSGWWDTTELRYATSLGVGVEYILRRQLCCEEEPILKEFKDKVVPLRAKDTVDIWKLFGLSVSGKFGQSRWRNIIKHHTEIQDFQGCMPLDSEERYFQFPQYIGGNAPYIKPAISMRVRSTARVRHLEMLLDALSRGDIYYCDNDSIFTSAILPTSTKVGDLSYIGKATRGYFIRPKLYALVYGDRLTQRSAGYSDTKLLEKDFQDLLNGKEIILEQPRLPSIRDLVEGKIFLSSTSRTLTGDWGSSRISMGDTTEPIHIKEKYNGIQSS